MATAPTSYPFDATGQAQTNRIVGEQIIVVAPGDRLFHYTMVKFAPMFQTGHKLKLRDLNNSVRDLIEGVDYYLTHKFADASLATMHPIFGSITFLKRDIVGTVIADYNTLGGMWTIDAQKITEILMNTIMNPRTTTWEQVVERPVDFPVIDHLWNLDDMVGQKEILEVLENFYEAYLQSLDPSGGGSGSNLLQQHINNKNNPHGVTAAQLGAYTSAQVDALLAGYLKTNAKAADSDKLNGKTYAQVMSDVKTTKVDNATYADTAGNATTADTAVNSGRLGGKTLLQIMQDVAATTVDNATKFAGNTYAQAKADILTGKSADSDKLGGLTLQQIIAQLSQSTGDAATLNGKTYAQIMADVKVTKVDAAVNADNADNATKLGGKTLQQVLADLGAVKPDMALDSEKVYGYTFEALVEAIIQSDTYDLNRQYESVMNFTDVMPVQSPNNGGTQDSNYIYALVGQFFIPTIEDATGVYYDPSVKQYSSVVELELFLGTRTIKLSVPLTILQDQSIVANVFTAADLLNEVYIGTRSVNSTLKSKDNTKTAKTNELWLKVRKTANLLRYGAAQYKTTSLLLSDDSVMNIYDHTFVNLNTVAWKQRDSSTEATILGQSITTLETNTQKALDDLADVINAAIATPAA